MLVAKLWYLVPLILFLARDSLSGHVRFICLGTNQMRLRSLGLIVFILVLLFTIFLLPFVYISDASASTEVQE